MKQGKLKLGDEAIAVQYELWRSNQREVAGKLVLGVTPPGPVLAQALAKIMSANLITEDGHVLTVEFTKNHDGRIVEFRAIPPVGYVL